jgi:hypothetical protein
MRSRTTFVRPLARVGLGSILAVLSVTVGLGASAGASGGATVLRRPGPPTALKLVPEGDAIVASWSPPSSDGGSPITGYIGTCSVVTGPTSCVLGITRKTGLPVTFHVQAVNAIGKGPGATGKAVAINEPDCRYLGPYANLTDCDLAGHDLAGLDLRDSEMGNVDLNRADLKGANVSAQVTGADLQHANLTDAVMDGANFAGTRLNDANLTGARVDGLFDGANLTGANLTDANMTGSEMYVNNHQDVAILADVVWSDTTCPDGTNSGADGGTCDHNLGSGAP